MRYPFDRGFKFKFFDQPWEAYLITEDEITELNDGKECAALTEDAENCLFISEGYVSKKIVGHELFHMRVKYFNLGSTDIGWEDLEEIVADWAGNEIESFIKTRNKIYNKFKKLEGSK
jgi:hypothetical protein